MRKLGAQLRTNVNTSKVYETNELLDKLNLEVSSRLRDVGNEILVLGQKTKSGPKDKNTPLRVSFQRKIAKDFKDTFAEYNRVKEENQKEAYKMFKHQYRISMFFFFFFFFYFFFFFFFFICFIFIYKLFLI